MPVRWKLSVFASAVAMMVCVPLGAQRVAVVDADLLTDRALESAPKEDRPEQLQKLQSEIQSRVEQIRTLEASLRQADGVLSVENLDRKRKEIARLRNEIDELDQRGRREIQRLNDLVFEPILKRVRYAIEDVALEKGIDLVIPLDRTLYVGPKMPDITDDVVARLRLPANDRETSPTAQRPFQPSPRNTPSGQRVIRPGSGSRSLSPTPQNR